VWFLALKLEPANSKAQAMLTSQAMAASKQSISDRVLKQMYKSVETDSQSAPLTSDKT
jgi:hypothetical protein